MISFSKPARRNLQAPSRRNLYVSILGAMALLQLVRIVVGLCRMLVFMSDKLPGGLPVRHWWMAIDARAVLWLACAPLLAALVWDGTTKLWKLSIAHAIIFIAALWVTGNYLLDLSRFQGESMQQLHDAAYARQLLPFRGDAATHVSEAGGLGAGKATLQREYAVLQRSSRLGFPYWAGESVLTLTYYLPMACLGAAVLHLRLSFFRARQTERLRALLIEQRHDSLCNRLTHHFLFNTFNTISSLTLTDGGAARTCISQLGDLLRASIDTLPKGEVRLDQELETLAIYLALQKTRFGEKLEYSIQVEEGLSGVMVPAFLLQPLVENSFQHGFRDRVPIARVEVSARREGDFCRLEVRDNGLMIEPGREIDEKYGLGITRERLELQYPHAARLWYEPNQPSGLKVSVLVPYRVESKIVA